MALAGTVLADKLADMIGVLLVQRLHVDLRRVSSASCRPFSA